MFALALFLLGFVVSAVAVRYAIIAAHRFDVVDKPGGHKAHDTVTPFVGGVGVLVANLCGVALVDHFFNLPDARVYAFVGGVIVMWATGFADDILNISFKIRLVIQAAVGLAMVYGAGIALQDLGHLASPTEVVSLGIIGVPLTLIATMGAINASSRNGRSSISIEFKSSRDIEAAANDVRDAVTRVADRMPDEARPPEIAKVESDAEPILWLNMNSDTMDTLQLSDYAERYVVDRFSSLDGVAQVRIGGRQRYAMRIWLDRDQLAARGMTVTDVESALQAENVELPAGSLESNARDYTLRVERSYLHPADFATIPLGKGSDGYVVRLGDVAKIELASAERRAYFRSNGKPNVGLGIVKTSTANALDVARAARAEAVKLESSLPKGKIGRAHV